MELGPFMHKHPTLDLGTFVKMILFMSTFYSNLTVKGSLYDAEISFKHEKEANSISPEN